MGDTKFENDLLDEFKEDQNDSSEPEVVKDVLKEIRILGENHKANYDELRKNYEELKKAMEEKSNDPLLEEKIVKLSEAVTVRQEALDKANAEMQKKVTERIDLVETVLNRMPKGIAGEDTNDTQLKEAREFFITAASVKGGDAGLSFKRAKDININIETFKNYVRCFQEYLRVDEKTISPDNFKTLLEGSDPDGGYTVTPEMNARIVTDMKESDPIRQLATVENISSNAIEFMVDWGDAGAEWESETVVSTDETTPQLRRKRISCHPLGTRPKASQTLIEDSGINIVAWLSGKVADRFGRSEAAAFITGNGVGKPRGFLTYTNGTAYGQIEQINTGAAAAVTADGFINIKYSLKEGYHTKSMAWLMNRLTVAKVMKLKDGSGEYIWKPSLTALDPTSSILGIPVKMSTTMPQVIADTLSIVLADWKEAYMIVDRIGITVLRDPYSAKPLIEFYFRKRVGGDVVNYESIKIGKIAA